MTLYEQVKQAIRRGASDADIACIFGVSETLVRRVREVVEGERKEDECAS